MAGGARYVPGSGGRDSQSSAGGQDPFTGIHIMTIDVGMMYTFVMCIHGRWV